MMKIPSQLQGLTEKTETIGTVSVEQLLGEPGGVQAAYRRHCLTYIPLGDVSDLQNRLLDAIAKGGTPKGMITAPWGYGKTATALSLWFGAEEAKYFAVPPFIAESLFDILRATYAWGRYVLAGSSHLAAQLEEAYKKRVQNTVASVAENTAREVGMSATAAEAMLEFLVRERGFRPELTANDLFDFLRDVAGLAQQAGFKGMVLFPDELQQYLDSGQGNLKNAIQELRSLVWRFDSQPQTPIGIGIMFSAPDTTEQSLTEYGNDILDRLKRERLYLNLRTIYDAEFPARANA